jgi:cellobiose phosphorylase
LFENKKTLLRNNFMKYGYFNDARREYVITRPDTPLPWINYLGSEEYFALISNTAGGYSFYKDARLRRISRYRYNNAPFDFGGRYIYLRDDENGNYWSPSWQPTQTELQEYSCRQGMGYTVIGSTYNGIRAETRYFVPLGENLEIWQMTITNQRNTLVDLSIFSAIEFCLWDALDDSTNFQRNFSIGQVEVEDNVIYHKTEYRERREHFAYYACSEMPSGFDTQREAFLGPYRSWDRPMVLERGRSTGSIAFGWQPIGSFHIQGSLQPGEQKQIIFLLGYFENPKDQKFDPPDSQTINKHGVKPVIAKYLDKTNAELAFDSLNSYWDQLLGVLQVQTPDEHVNRMVNVWNAYQCMATFNMSRSASLFESGIGRGLGFRDSNQDLLGFVQMVPARARQRILDLASTQRNDGGAYHQYQPMTRRGNDAIGSNFNDDPHWLVLGVAAYLRETGDWGILDELVPYDNQPGSEMPLFEHLQRSIQYTLDRIGPHGLPLIGRADWNDCLNLNCFSDTPGESFQTTTNRDGKVAESVFIAGLFVLSTREMAQIAERYGAEAEKYRPGFDVNSATHYSKLAEDMTTTIYQHGWDGEWFLRAYDDLGQKVGSAECKEGKIYIEPQGFCVLAGVGLENGYAKKALASVNEQLATKHGILLLQPPYSKYYLNLGEISSYPPGYKENASIFCHNNPWVMIAEAKIGNGDRALDYYLRINPSAREELSEIHRCEPYVYAQTIAGRDAAAHGEAKNSWLTGTAAWNYVTITQWILGIRPELDGLRVDPCIPSGWSGFSATRRFRGKKIHIIVHNPLGVCRGVVKMTVDEKIIAGNMIPLDLEGNEHRVEVWLG